jgi:4-hydroxybenzoate polyprenyltransferase
MTTPELNRAPIYQIFRAAEWWDFKIAPVLGITYATAFVLNLSIVDLWPLLLLIIVAVAPCAAFVSILNDLTDIDEDLAIGKTNRLVGRSSGFIAAALACCIIPGLAVAVYLRGDRLLLFLYAGSWLAFIFYSVRPVRLKARGVLGLIADALGAHLFPTLLAVALVYRWRGDPIDPLWFASIAVWALSAGLRGNLWHQLSDRANDTRIGVRTFAQRYAPSLLHALGDLVIFPLELGAFAVILWRGGSHWAIVLLGPYALLELSRRVVWKVNLVVVAPQPRSSILMLEYYELFFPIAMLISSSLRYPRDGLLIAGHLLIFYTRAIPCGKDVIILMKGAVSRYL